MASMIKRRLCTFLGHWTRSKVQKGYGACPGELPVREFLLDRLGAGYTRIWYVHLSPTESFNWKIKAKAMVCESQMKTDVVGAPRRWDPTSESQPKEREREIKSAALGKNVAKSDRSPLQILVFYLTRKETRK